MGQQSITTFFKVEKRKQNELETKKDPKRLRQEPAHVNLQIEPPKPKGALNGSANRGSMLNAYARGQQLNPLFISENQDLHKRFYDELVGRKLHRNKNGERRPMKPYDLQFIELKKQNMDSILMIQNGYKYQILGDDAYKVSRFLGRSPVSGWRTLMDEGNPEDALYDRFASLTFPLERLPFYVDKLVVQGLKVAVAKQVETSALKARSDNKRGPFQRKVTNVYTQGTMVEELTMSTPVSGYLLSLKQTENGFAVIAVQVATGSGMYDLFEDDRSLAMELETRLLHMQPSEILVVNSDISGAALKMISSLDIRIVNINTSSANALKCTDDIPDFISSNTDLEECWTALHQYLAEFDLSNALKLGLKPFTLQSFMYLGGDTLSSLEIYENQTTNEKRGSLLWALDSTKTAFGRRLMRIWIGRPLLDRNLLAERVEAMEELMGLYESDSETMSLFKTLHEALGKLPDLERYTLQTYHQRINPKQLYWFLYHFKNFLTSITDPEINAAKVRSPVLQSILDIIGPVRSVIESLLSHISAAGARGSRSNTYNGTSNGSNSGNVNLAAYFKYKNLAEESLNADLQELKQYDESITQCQAEFTAFLELEETKLGCPLKQVFPVGEENTFVIGVLKSKSSKIPASWRRQGATSTEVRFWAPFSQEQSRKLKPLLEQQALAAQQAYDNFVSVISENHFSLLRKSVSKLATLDCLFSMATVSLRPDYVKPDIVDEPCLEIDDGRHPMLEQLIQGKVIPNSTEMHASQNRVMIITGVNMGGKSSYVRQVALLVIMAQIGYYVPARRARLSLMDAVFTRMGAFDNLIRGESTFMVELKECSAIMAKASQKSLIIMDEIGRGTSTVDGVAIADAVLQYVIDDVKAFTLFITHYPSLGEKAKHNRAAQLWSMDCAENKDEVTFLYKIVAHQASPSYGINVARLAGISELILQAARFKSCEFESNMEYRRNSARLLQSLEAVLRGRQATSELMQLHTQSQHSKNREVDEIEEIQETQE